MSDVIKSVGTAGGRDYSSLAAAVAALPANLVTADQNWIFELYNDTEFSGNVSLSGHTTDATRCITFRPATGQGFYDAGTKLSTALRYNQTQGVGIIIPGDFLAEGWVIADNYVFIDGLQFHHSGNATTYNLIKWDGNNGRMSRCIVQDSGAQGSGRALVRINGSSGLVNVLGIERNTLQADRVSFLLENDSAYAINCGALRTVTDGGSNRAAYERGYNSPLIRNCWSFGWSKFGRDTTAAAGSGYNATNLAAGNVPGANNQYSLVASDQLENVTANSEDCRLKSTSTIKTLGTRDQTYTADLDMLKTARSVTTPAIGPQEYAAPPAAPTITGPSGAAGAGTSTANIAENATTGPTFSTDIALGGGYPTLTGAQAANWSITALTATSWRADPVTPFDFEAGGLVNPQTVVFNASASVAQTCTVTITNASEPPLAPTIGTATAGNASASVAFTPPSNTGRPAITGYTATSSPGGLTGTGASSPITVSGLTNGTAYTFTVAATNADGTGPASAASNSVTPSAGVSAGSFNLNNAIYTFKRKDNVVLASLGVTFFVNNHLTGELIGAAITGLSTNASGIVTTPVSNASVVAGATYRLSWRFSSGEYGQIEMQAA